VECLGAAQVLAYAPEVAALTGREVSESSSRAAPARSARRSSGELLADRPYERARVDQRRRRRGGASGLRRAKPDTLLDLYESRSETGDARASSTHINQLYPPPPPTPPLARSSGGHPNFHKLPHLTEVNNGSNSVVARTGPQPNTTSSARLRKIFDGFKRAHEFPTTEEHLADARRRDRVWFSSHR